MHADRLRGERTTITTTAASTPWTGPDAEQWRASLDVRCRRLADIERVLEDLGTALVAHADEQTETSAADAVGVGFGGTPSPGLQPGASSGEGTNTPDTAAAPMTPDEVRAQLLRAAYMYDLDPKQLGDMMKDLSEPELRILGVLLDHGMSTSQLADFLRGGQVVFDDPAVYDQFRALAPDGYERVSSHHESAKDLAPHIGVPGELNALFGRTDHGTFIQLEHSEWGQSVGESFQHGIDYVAYDTADGDIDHVPVIGSVPTWVVSPLGAAAVEIVSPVPEGHNVGPLGTSPHRDDNPITLD